VIPENKRRGKIITEYAIVVISVAFATTLAFCIVILVRRRRMARRDISTTSGDAESGGSSSPIDAQPKMEEMDSPFSPVTTAGDRWRSPTLSRASSYTDIRNEPELAVASSSTAAASSTVAASLTVAVDKYEALPSPSSSVRQARHAQALAAFCKGAPSHIAWGISSRASSSSVVSHGS
jgi:cytoskeletal protein RodZ